MACFVDPNHLDQDSHHIHPTCYGGAEDGPQVPLCSTCHRNVHLIAEAVADGRSYDSRVFTAEQIPRARLLVISIVRAKLEFQANPDSTVLRRIVAHVPQALLTRIHKRKADLGLSSIHKYLLYLIVKDLSGFKSEGDG